MTDFYSEKKMKTDVLMLLRSIQL